MPEYYTIQQCDVVTLDNDPMPYIKSLYSCLNRVKGDGYTEDFEKTPQGIHCISSKQNYAVEDFKIISSFRFEGNQRPGDNKIMYMIETTDGIKGTLVNSYELVND